MHMKKLLLILISLVVLALVICLIVVLGGQNNGKQTANNPGGIIQTTATEVTDPAAESTTPSKDGPVQDSIFDNEDTQATQATKPTVGNTATDSPVPPSVDTIPPASMTYEQFHAMSPGDQRLYMESFGDIEAFFNWYNAAKAQYEKDHPAIDVGDGSVDLSKLPGANP